MIKRDIPKSVRHCLTSLLEQLTKKILEPNSNRHKHVELWTKSINFVNLGCYFPCATSAKNPRSMYARVPQVMAQFVLKMEKLSHIMGPTPILKMARAYGLRPRLWLLFISTLNILQYYYHCHHHCHHCHQHHHHHYRHRHRHRHYHHYYFYYY